MFQTMDELKAFMHWCKTEKVESVSVDGVSFKFSPLAFIPDEKISESSGELDYKGISDLLSQLPEVE